MHHRPVWCLDERSGEGGKEGGGSASGGGGGDGDERARQAEERKDRARNGPTRVLQPGIYNLADLDSEMLEQAFVLMGVGADERMNAEGATLRIVPVEVKAQVVEALRHIAMSNEENRERITQDKVIPGMRPFALALPLLHVPRTCAAHCALRLGRVCARHAALVKLMTKMQAADDGKSGQSGQSGKSGESDGSNGKKKGRKGKGIGADRKQLAQQNRRLAESAGRVLHELILLGSGVVKQKIISAIIATVQQPGSVPPEDVPALMTILRSAAEEQLMLVQQLDSLSGLLSALEFGRWIKVPIIKLGEARKNFMTAQEARKRQIRKGTAGAPSATGPSASAEASAPAGAPAAAGSSNPAANAPAANGRSSAREGGEKTALSRPRRKRTTSKERKRKLQAELVAFATAEKDKQSRRCKRMERQMMSALATMTEEDWDTKPMELGTWYMAYKASVRVDAEAHFMAQEAYISASRLPQTEALVNRSSPFSLSRTRRPPMRADRAETPPPSSPKALGAHLDSSRSAALEGTPRAPSTSPPPPDSARTLDALSPDSARTATSVARSVDKEAG